MKQGQLLVKLDPHDYENKVQQAAPALQSARRQANAALMIAGVWYGIKQQRPQLQLLKQGNWWGIISMAISLASLEVVLEEGNRKDWFGSPCSYAVIFRNNKENVKIIKSY